MEKIEKFDKVYGRISTIQTHIGDNIKELRVNRHIYEWKLIGIEIELSGEQKGNKGQNDKGVDEDMRDLQYN